MARKTLNQHGRQGRIDLAWIGDFIPGGQLLHPQDFFPFPGKLAREEFIQRDTKAEDIGLRRHAGLGVLLGWRIRRRSPPGVQYLSGG